MESLYYIMHIFYVAKYKGESCALCLVKIGNQKVEEKLQWEWLVLYLGGEILDYI